MLGKPFALLKGPSPQFCWVWVGKANLSDSAISMSPFRCLMQVGQTILVQEYMENGDLFHAISEDMAGRFGWYRRKHPTGRPIPNTGMARRIALDTARGLFFLHSRR